MRILFANSNLATAETAILCSFGAARQQTIDITNSIQNKMNKNMKIYYINGHHHVTRVKLHVTLTPVQLSKPHTCKLSVISCSTKENLPLGADLSGYKVDGFDISRTELDVDNCLRYARVTTENGSQTFEVDIPCSYIANSSIVTVEFFPTSEQLSSGANSVASSSPGSLAGSHNDSSLLGSDPIGNLFGDSDGGSSSEPAVEKAGEKWVPKTTISFFGSQVSSGHNIHPMGERMQKLYLRFSSDVNSLIELFAILADESVEPIVRTSIVSLLSSFLLRYPQMMSEALPSSIDIGSVIETAFLGDSSDAAVDAVAILSVPGDEECRKRVHSTAMKMLPLVVDCCKHPVSMTQMLMLVQHLSGVDTCVTYSTLRDFLVVLAKKFYENRSGTYNVLRTYYGIQDFPMEGYSFTLLNSSKVLLVEKKPSSSLSLVFFFLVLLFSQECTKYIVIFLSLPGSHPEAFG